jgi:hypothetical protein
VQDVSTYSFIAVTNLLLQMQFVCGKANHLADISHYKIFNAIIHTFMSLLISFYVPRFEICIRGVYLIQVFSCHKKYNFLPRIEFGQDENISVGEKGYIDSKRTKIIFASPQNY